VEAATVVELVAGLLGSGAGVVPGDIGVMATYRRQVAAVRALLRRCGLGEIRVGTVDDYQGQEARIVFITTVLSRPADAGGGDAHVAIWRNPRRFNVAITRARALLVVVGHPVVLLEDPSWRELLRHCFANGAYRGAGADAIRRRFRVDPGAGGAALPGLALAPGEGGGGTGGGGDEAAELEAAIAQLAELALLGAGDADRLWPDSLDEMHAAYSAETQWRVML
jgi:putative helicase MOV10L1